MSSRQQEPGGLPPLNTVHWSARRKAQVVLAVRSGRLALDEARRRYRLSPEELAGWERALDRGGVEGLQLRSVQASRRSAPRPPQERRAQA